MALLMAEHEMERGVNAEVIAFAERVRDAQSAELETLRAAEKQLVEAEEGLPAAPRDPHSEADMAIMLELAGEELDRMFLIEMIEHHASGLAPAHRAVPHLTRTDLRSMANQIFAAQAREIGEMRAALAVLGVEDSGQDEGPATPNRVDLSLFGDRRIPLTPNGDTAFVDFFIPHHEAAIEMAEHVITHGMDAEVSAMAEAVVETQAAEVKLMRDLRTELEGSGEPPMMEVDPHADVDMPVMMRISGQDLDRMFLEEMIAHHAAGLPTAHRARPHVKRPELAALATAMYLAQADEIGKMTRSSRQWLSEHN